MCIFLIVWKKILNPKWYHDVAILKLIDNFGGLSDEYIIFNNLYGEQNWRINDATKHGNYRLIIEIMNMGPG